MTKSNSTLIDPSAIGVELSWSFGDGDAEAVTIPRDEMRRMLDENGFDPKLVGEFSEDLALRKALHTVKGRSKTIVVQELRRPRKDTPRAFGVYKVIGKEGEAGDDVRMGARVRCAAKHVVCLPPEGQDHFDPECEKVGKEMARIANSLLDNVINWGISEILTTIGWSSLGWINRRRNSGGVYFVSTSPTAESFVRLLQDIQRCSVRLAADKKRPRNYHFIPEVMEVYPKPLTMSMWKESAQAQYEAQTAQLVKDLEKMQGADGDKMRDKTVQARADECDRLIAQAETHRLFLEDAVESVTKALTAVRDGFAKRLADNAQKAKAAFEEIDKATPARKRKKAAKKAPARKRKKGEMPTKEEAAAAFDME